MGEDCGPHCWMELGAPLAYLESVVKGKHLGTWPVFVVGASIAQVEAWMPGDRTLVDVRDGEALRARRPIIVAHRGGVIGTGKPQCSLAAIREAAVRGYDMVELDVQQTQDGHAIVFHDNSLRTACDLGSEVRDLTREQITSLVYRASQEKVATLGEALALCSELSLGVMLDIKSYSANAESYFSGIAAMIEANGLARATVTISQDALARKYLSRAVMLVVSWDDQARIKAGEMADLSDQYWFDAARELDPGHVDRYHRAGAFVLPAINTFLYPAHADRLLAREDVDSLWESGVDGFQIDSVYEDLMPGR